MATYTLDTSGWAALVGETLTSANTGLAALGSAGLLEGSGESHWVIREIEPGLYGLASTGNGATANRAAYLSSTAWLAAALATVGNAVRFRMQVRFDQGTLDGTAGDGGFTTQFWSRAATGRPRVTLTIGQGNAQNGEHLGHGYGSFTDVTPVTDQYFRYGTTYTLDAWIERLDASTYRTVLAVDGVVVAVDSDTALTDPGYLRGLNWQNTLWDVDDPRVWIQLLGAQVDSYATGGFVGNCQHVEDDGLGDWPADALITLHGPSGTVAAHDLTGGIGRLELDSWWNWVAMLGTVDTSTPYDANEGYSAVIAWTAPIRIVQPDGAMISSAFPWPSQDGRCGFSVPLMRLRDCGLRIVIRDAATDDDLVGFDIAQGTGDATIDALRWDDQGPPAIIATGTFAGVTLNRSRDDGDGDGATPVAYVLHFSFAEGKPVGLLVEDCKLGGQAAAHLQVATSSVIVGNPVAAGTLVRVVLEWEPGPGTDAVEFFGPVVGSNGLLAPSSYTAGTQTGSPNYVVPPSNLTPQVRRPYGGERGRGPSTGGFGRAKRPGGPFCFIGRSGASIGNLINDHLGGATLAQFWAATQAYGVHLVSMVNSIGDRGATGNQANWDLYGEQNVADYQSNVTEFTASARAAGGVVVLGPTPSPPANEPSGWLADQVDAHRALNEWLREQNAAGVFRGHYVFDIPGSAAGEETATTLYFPPGDIHPDEDYLYQQALYGTLEPAGPLPVGLESAVGSRRRR